MAGILVPFEGGGSGTGSLSWGQLQIWLAMQRKNSSLGIGGVVPLAPGRTVASVAGDLRFIMSRHPSLRTRLRFGPGGQPQQVVASSGTVLLEVAEAGGADPEQVASAVHRRYEELFDYAHEWPVRWAVVTRDGVPAYLVSVICHLAADGLGVLAMLADLAAHGPGTGRQAGPVAGWQPLEQARRQATPAARRQSQIALRHWEKLLRDIPARRVCGLAGPQEPRYWQAFYDSPAAYLAVRAVSARTGAPTSVVLLAAFAVALARVTGASPVVTQILVSNRFRPGLAGTVSPVSQTGLCAIEAADASLDEVLSRAWRGALAAAKYAYYHPADMFALVNEAGRERGEDIDLECFFNDRRMQDDEEPASPVPTAPDITAALPHSTLTWGYRIAGPSERLFFHLNKAPGTLNFELCWDTHSLAPAAAETILREVEAAAVQSALDPSALTKARPAPAPT